MNAKGSAVMNAMVLEHIGQPLLYKQMPVPKPSALQVLVKIYACGVCRTDLHIIDGELKDPHLPLILGHEIIGEIIEVGNSVTQFKKEDVIGIPWLGYTCGTCKYCLRGAENLCENAMFTGYTLNGGYAEYTVAYEQFCFHLSPNLNNISKAPLLCAGLIGYRSYSMVPADAKTIGLYGFGAAAHILLQVAMQQGKEIYAFTRDGDAATQQFARKLGAVWSGGSSEPSPVKLDAAIIFAPIGKLIISALENVDKGGAIICGGIHMNDIPSFPYRLLWEERSIRSVANLTRQDAKSFLAIAAEIDIHMETKFYPLQKANEALKDLKAGSIHGAAVLVMN
jgi:propanol-preferring alcohol dehydrogenase